MMKHGIDLPPVCRSADELAAELKQPGNSLHCLFLAHRENWNTSMSYTMLNSLLGIRYIPVDLIDSDEVDQVFELAFAVSTIIGINLSFPYKNHQEARRRCRIPMPDVVDFLLFEDGAASGIATNGIAFLQWFQREEGSVADRQFVICGTGASGSAIAHALRANGAGNIILVDPLDRSKTALALGNASWRSSLQAVKVAPDSQFALILALPEMLNVHAELREFLSTHQRNGSAFVDIRTSTNEAVRLARDCKWTNAYAGDGMANENIPIVADLLKQAVEKRVI